MNIKPSEAGTPDQKFVPANVIAVIDPVDNGSKTMNLPSSAGIGTYNEYFMMVFALNPGVLPNWSTDPGAVSRAQVLSNAMQQEWVTNPDSGHNKVMG